MTVSADDRQPTDRTDSPSERAPTRVDVAVIGGGTAAETLVGALDGSDMDIVVFESDRVGGECPFVACMPSKAMLHDAAAGRSWNDAIRRRQRVVDHLDDASHASELADHGATLVRERAVITAPGEVAAGGRRYHAEHIVLATGSEAIIPPIDGIDDLGDRCWTSAEALTSEVRPTRLTILGAGVVGCELATLYAGFGTEVHLIDAEPTAFSHLPPEIGTIVDEGLQLAGVRVRRGVEVDAIERRGNSVRVRLEDGVCLDTDHLLVAAGTRPRTRDIGLEHLGVSASDSMTVGADGRVDAQGSVWAIGDVAGRGAYTHLASHQARAVADSLTGPDRHRFDDVVVPACVFTDPPVVTIGSPPADLGAAVMWESARMSEIPRWSTDDLGDGFLTIAVDRATRAVVAAHGVGAHFDVLAAALVTAIDAKTPVDQLARSMWPFPTVGELLGVVYSRASASLAAL